MVVLVASLLGAAFVTFTFLTSATVFFCNADQVDVKAECSAPKRFRLQGSVDQGSVRTGTPLMFTVSFGGRSIPVTYQGDPGGIFCEGVPVVVEGHYQNGTFDGDRILVKHTEQYKAANPGRFWFPRLAAGIGTPPWLPPATRWHLPPAEGPLLHQHAMFPSWI